MNQKEQKISISSHGLLFTLSILSIITAISLSLSSCFVHEVSTEPANEHIKIKGSGVLVSEELDLPYFHSIRINTAGLVNTSSGDEQYVEISVDDNVLEYLSVYVRNEVLVIEIINNVSLSEFNLTVDVVMTDLRALTTNSAGSIKGLNTFEEDEINLTINSAGSISLDLKANQLNTMINSAGSMLLSGEAVCHNSILSSAGHLLAFALETDTTMIMLNSAGNASVWVLELLEVTINSVGCLYYKGHPRIIQDINSIGCVISAN
jgi:hypothetical protein